MKGHGNFVNTEQVNLAQVFLRINIQQLVVRMLGRVVDLCERCPFKHKIEKTTPEKSSMCCCENAKYSCEITFKREWVLLTSKAIPGFQEKTKITGKGLASRIFHQEQKHQSWN